MENFEKVEAYFENRLGVDEKKGFLKEVESNPELKSEFEFQRQVIEGIKEVRKAELKTMLDNVPIASVGTSTSVLSKIIAGGATALLVVSGIYWYYINSSASLPAEKNQITVDSTLDDSSGSEENDFKENSDLLSDEEHIEVKQKDNEVKNSTKSDKTKATPKVKTPELPSTDDSFSTQSLPEENLDIPETVSNASVNLNSKVDVEIKMKKKYNFHYQFISGKLVLYGDFEDEPFEVLEVNGSGNREMYLYYKSNYYYIKDMTGAISPLESVKEPSLLEKLKNLR